VFQQGSQGKGGTFLIANELSTSANNKESATRFHQICSDIELSVIIPTHNRDYYLDRTLDSLFKQDYPLSKYEVIVVDDASTDDTVKVLNKFLKKYSNLKVIRNSENKGSCYSRTLAVNRAKARVVVFTDSDCVLYPDWLCKISRRFEGERVLCVQGTQECEGKWGKFMYEGKEALRFFKKRNILDTKNLAIDRNLFLKYKFDLKMRTSCDYELGQRLSKDVKIVYDPNICVIHFCDNFQTFLTRGRNWGKAQAYTYKKHGPESVNPKFKYPILFLFFYYLGTLFYFSLRYRSLRGGIAFFVTTFTTALSFKNNIVVNNDK
jgi:glycosyltransferase involved in cell wall biosynthesis